MNDYVFNRHGYFPTPVEPPARRESGKKTRIPFGGLVQSQAVKDDIGRPRSGLVRWNRTRVGVKMLTKSLTQKTQKQQ